MADPKWNDEKTEVTLTADDYNSLKQAPTDAHDKGFGKGKEKGKKEVLQHFDFLELDPDNLGESVGKIKNTLIDIQQGKIPEALQGKIKETELVKSLQETITKKDEIIDKSKKEFDSYKRTTLIDSKIATLAASDDHTALNPEQVRALFKMEYNLDLDGDQVTITKEGKQLVDEKANPKEMSAVFGEWAKANPHLFKGNGNGGSGGGNNNTNVNGVKFSDLKTQKEKDAFIKQHGIEAYQKLMESEFKS